MEVAITRTAIRHTLSALAAVALVFAFTNSPVLAQWIMWAEDNGAKPKAPDGLATKGPDAQPKGRASNTAITGVEFHIPGKNRSRH